ncbi:MAG TPA: OstA-like protein [Bacillota bacterium]
MLAGKVTPVSAAVLDEQILIEAAGGVDYDLEQNITTAAREVKLTRGKVQITADELVYYGNTGIVEASGNVRLTNQRGEYRTEHLTYNVFTSSGSLASFTATLKGNPKDFHLQGEGLELTPESSVVAKVEITRCPKANPDYVLRANRVKIIGQKVQLKHVVVKVYGIPVFYLPLLSFNTNQNLPELVPGYQNEDGLKLRFNFPLSGSAISEWTFKGDLSSRGDESTLGMEYTTSWDRSKNQFDLLYNLDGWWHLADVFTYETSNLRVTADGYRDFSDSKERQLGVKITRKFWDTAIGAWQIGVLSRKAKAFETQEFGGTYFGVQVDYKPYSNVKLSYLRIKSLTDGDYGDLMEDFGVGDNLLYEISIPIGADLRFSMNGSYNLDESEWYHQVYSLTKTDCCFSPTISYDRADHSWEGKVGFRF